MLSSHTPNEIKAVVGAVCKYLSFGRIWLPKRACICALLWNADVFAPSIRWEVTLDYGTIATLFVHVDQMHIFRLIAKKKKNPFNLYTFILRLKRTYIVALELTNPNLFSSWTQRNRIFFFLSTKSANSDAEEQPMNAWVLVHPSACRIPVVSRCTCETLQKCDKSWCSRLFS